MPELPARPHGGEPLPLDLLNTAWADESGPVDYLALPGGAAAFSAEHGVALPDGAGAAEALSAARAVVRDLAAGRRGAALAARAGAVVARARIAVEAGEGGALAWRIVSPDDAWTVAARAVVEGIDLMARHGDRVRQCAHPACVLWFLDTSRNGARRWHSMAICGNRTKARRHYERTRGGGADG